MDLLFPPMDRFRIRLRLTAGAHFHFLHGGVLRGLVSGALGQHELPPGVIPFAAESGRVDFVTGDVYHLGMTLAGEDRGLVGRLFAGLVRVGGERPARGPLPTLGGNFEVEAIEPLPSPDLDAEVAALSGQREVVLELLSPLRLRRPDELVRRGAAYLNGDCFPAGHFLERLWARLFLLTHGRYPERGELAGLPASLEEARTVPGDMPWLDLPVNGSPGKGRSYTLGGAMGRVRWRRPPDDWLHLLVAGRHLHAGAGAAYGLGRYRLGTDSSAGAEPFLPARRLCPPGEMSPELLERSFDALLEDSSLAFRLGLSRQGAERAERRALEEGFRWRAPVDLAELVSAVEPRLVGERLRAVLPLHVVDDVLPDDLGALSSSLLASLARLVLPEIRAALDPDRRLVRMGDGFHLLSRRRVQPEVLDGGWVGRADRKWPGEEVAVVAG